MTDRVTIGAIDESLIADEALPEAEIKKTAKEELKAIYPSIFAVDNRFLLATTWGRLKSARKKEGN